MECKDCGEYCYCGNMKIPPCGFCETHAECIICGECTCWTVQSGSDGEIVPMCGKCQEEV